MDPPDGATPGVKRLNDVWDSEGKLMDMGHEELQQRQELVEGGGCSPRGDVSSRRADAARRQHRQKKHAAHATPQDKRASGGAPGGRGQFSITKLFGADPLSSGWDAGESVRPWTAAESQMDIGTSSKGCEEELIAAIEGGGNGTSLNVLGASKSRAEHAPGRQQHQQQQQQQRSPRASEAPSSPKEGVVAAHSVGGGGGDGGGGAGSFPFAVDEGLVPPKGERGRERRGSKGGASPLASLRGGVRGHSGLGGGGGGGGSGRGEGGCAETRLRVPPPSSGGGSAANVQVKILTLDVPKSLPPLVSRGKIEAYSLRSPMEKSSACSPRTAAAAAAAAAAATVPDIRAMTPRALFTVQEGHNLADGVAVAVRLPGIMEDHVQSCKGDGWGDPVLPKTRGSRRLKKGADGGSSHASAGSPRPSLSSSSPSSPLWRDALSLQIKEATHTIFGQSTSSRAIWAGAAEAGPGAGGGFRAPCYNGGGGVQRLKLLRWEAEWKQRDTLPPRKGVPLAAQ